MKRVLGILVMILVLFAPMTVHASEIEIPEGYVIAELDPMDFYTEADIARLEKLTYAEAGNQSLEVQTWVALVVLNRTKSNDFPDTIEEVIRQRGKNGVYQFSCVPNGMYDRAVPTEQVKQAVQDALYAFVNDMREVPDELLYFNSIGYFNWSTVEDYAHNGAMYFSVAK